LTHLGGSWSRESAINWQLLDLQSVLTYERQRHPQIVGSSVSSLDDIYTAWKRFIEGRCMRSDQRPLYFVKGLLLEIFTALQI